MQSGTAPTRRVSLTSPERWEKIKGIFDAAIQLPEQARPEFLHSVCCGDAELEAELQHLIATYERTATSLELSAGAALTYAQNDESSRVLRNGQLLAGRFGVIRFIDSGGMGEVYEAWDAELQDLVALKTIRQEISAIPTVIDRFKQEVKRARAISHPNVCRVYDLFSHDLGASGQRLWFLTMELLVGPTLAERLRKQGPIGANEALNLVEQVVAGLAAAHDLGVVHRDFKSSNVMLVPAAGNRTRAVITDFGLSVALSPGEYDGKQMARGGTPAYMAPEQASGGRVGLAADQYALGVVICEMLTGTRPKRSADDQVALDSRLSDPAIGPQWEQIVRRCLQTVPERRFGSIREIAVVLHPPKMGRTREKLLISAAAALIALVMIAVAFAQKPLRLERLSELTAGTDFSIDPSISQDGSVVAFSSDRAQTGNLDIWLQHLPKGAPVRLTTDSAEDILPSVAPDGSSVVFRSERSGGGIYIANSSGQGERLIAAGGRNPRFSPDGRHIVYWTGDHDDSTPSGKLYVLSLEDGHVQQLAGDFADARWPVWSSNGNYILFAGCRAASVPIPTCREWWAASTDGSKVQDTGAVALLRRSHVEPIEGLGGWYGENVLFTGRNAGSTSVWEIKISPNNLQAKDTPQRVTSGVSRDVDPVLAQNGTFVFAHLSAALHVWRIAHADTPSSIESARITEDAGTDSNPSVSRDGHWLAFSRLSGTRRDLWVKNLASGGESLLDVPGSEKMSPQLNDTGSLVAYETRTNDVPAIYVADKISRPKKLCDNCAKPSGWFGQDAAVLYRSGTPSKIMMAEAATGSSKTVLEQNGISLSEADWSSSNEYLLFSAAVGDRKQIFAVRFPKSTGKATGSWVPITEESGFSERPKWSGDGQMIFYVSRRDGFSCVWGQHFDARVGKPEGVPFAVMHYHNLRTSPAHVAPYSFDLSVSGDDVYLNIAEETASLWTGVLKPSGQFFWPF